MRTHPYLIEARKTGNPVIDGDVATFIWQGASPPSLIDDVHNWDDSPQTLSRIGKELWSFSISLSSDAYLEYAFLNPKTGERVPDPLNPRRIWNGINAYNHYFYMPQGKPSPLVFPDKGIPRGTFTRYTLPTLDYAASSTRSVYLYYPPVNEPVPLLIVYDGTEYMQRGKLGIIVDNLIARKTIQPFAMAMIQNGGPARSVEYSSSEATLGLLMECVLPLAKENLNLEPVDKGNYGIMGASLGGSMALYSSLRLPQVFRKILSQSGAFIGPDYQFVVADLVRYIPRPDIDIWMDVGKLEWLLDGNRQMHALLKGKKYRVKYREFAGGHNYTSWRNDIWHGLESLYKI